MDCFDKIKNKKHNNDKLTTTFRPPNMLKMFRNLRIRRFLDESNLLVDESLVDESVFLVDEPRAWLMNPPFLVDESNLLVDESLVDESVFLVDESG